MKKTTSRIMAAAAAMALCGALAACGSSSGTNETTTAAGAAETTAAAGGSNFKASSDITVISREDGSGTRGAFVELFGVEQKNDQGEKIDYTIDTASITQSTGVMKTSVSQNEYAIGYISLGALDDTVKALKIDGVEATADNIKNGTYKISRPFNIVTTGDVSPLAQDFIDFIMSADGQAVIEGDNYIPVSDAPAYSGTKQSGTITVAGSSSVTPVMEKLKEAYVAVNPDVTVEVNQSDSTTGVNSAIDGICDIGMASRELKDSETEKGAVSTVIAMDGITVIVSNDNPVAELTANEVKDIYTGNITTWESLVD
ncbi:substrate-binding domain-containing protein [Huintestinicola sp.]|uniref:substrate-binding domain-containing protein n=1 Tax=Huintestinicola sp. TaxID=2981661 RepID=UPI003D7E4EE6